MTASAPAPDWSVHTWFNIESRHGADRQINLASLRGRVIVMVAFQALCPNSVSVAVPQAIRIFNTFEPRDVAVIGLHATFEHHAAITSAVIKAFMYEYRIKFPVGVDTPVDGSPIPQTMDRYQMRGTPSLVLIDRDGLIRKHAFGAVDDLRLGAEIGALVQGKSELRAQSSAA